MLKSSLWVIGDSTLSSFQDKYYYPRYGYGTMLDKYLDDTIEVKNIALSGRSSKSYTLEPEYKTLIGGMKEGDFLLIGFGHNDEKTEEGRFTDSNGGIEAEGSFAASLYNNYIVPARAAGCRVILTTPIVRRTADGEWKPQELHITSDVAAFKGGDYPESIRKLAERLDLPLVDMTKLTKELYDKLGPDNTKYLHAWTSNKESSVDNTHTNIWGGRVNAHMVLEGIKKLCISGLSEHVINLEEDVMNKDKYLIPDKEYKPLVFTTDLPDSRYWKDTKDGFKGTVFGDIGEEGNFDLRERFILEELEDGKIHMAAKNNTGKIALGSDGIAMYYKKVPASQTFVLQASVTVNDFFVNDQVSFGLMVRDDVYIDKAEPGLLGDYVAAGTLHLTKREECDNCFARKSGKLITGGQCTREYKPGDRLKLRIESTEDGYACTFAEEHTVTGGFDFKLTAVDPDNVYVGMFVARNADVTFGDVQLIIK